MQESRTTTRNLKGSRQFLTPTRAFLITLSAVAFSLGLWLATGTESPSMGAQAQQAPPSRSISESDLLSQFEDLQRSLMVAYRTQDPTLVDALFTSTSPVRRIVFDDLERLQQDNVNDLTTQRQRQLEILSSEAHEVKLQESVVVRPRFLLGGEDITKGARRVNQIVTWTLRTENGDWLIHDSVVTSSQKARGR